MSDGDVDQLNDMQPDSLQSFRGVKNTFRSAMQRQFGLNLDAFGTPAFGHQLPKSPKTRRLLQGS